MFNHYKAIFKPSGEIVETRADSEMTKTEFVTIIFDRLCDSTDSEVAIYENGELL